MDSRPLFVPNIDPFWIRFGSFPAPFWGTLRVAILDENAWDTNVFILGAPKRPSFLLLFGLDFDYILIPFWYPFGTQIHKNL